MRPLDAAIAVLNEQPTPDDSTALIVAKCRALMRGYAARWQDADLVPYAVEKTGVAALRNPETQAKSRTFQTAGKEDVLCARGAKRILIDHKSTTDDIQDPAGPYWSQLVVESQPSHYMLLEWLNGEKIDEAIWDVIRKPSISPRQFKSKAEKALAVSSRRWFDSPLTAATMDYLQTGDKENLEMYEARLANDCTSERPQWYFQRRTLPRLDSEILEYAADLWDAGQLIIEARRLNRWPKHPGACMAYNTPCKYLGICSGFSRPDGPDWKPVERVHGELPQLPGDGRDTITFSSVRTFQVCPRKYYYRYQLGIEKIGSEDSEALRIGTILHIGFEAYWKALIPAKESDYGNGHTDSPNSGECAASQTVDACGCAEGLNEPTAANGLLW